MLIINRFIPLISLILLSLLGEVFIFYSQGLFPAVILSGGFLFIFVWQLTGRRIKNIELWSFLIPVLFLFWGWIFLTIFFEVVWIKQLFLLLVMIFIFVLFYNIFLFLHQPLSYKVYSLENISNYLNLFIVWLWFSSFFGLVIFLGLPSGAFVFPVIILGALIYSQNLWINKINLKDNWLFLVIAALLLAEMFLAVSFLPTDFYVNGLILAVAYYLLAGFSRDFILKKLDRAVIIKNLSFSIIILAAVLTTAKWQ